MKFSVIVFVITLCFGVYMASEPDVVNLTKEDQKDLDEYIVSVLKSIRTSKVEFYTEKLKDKYNSIFTAVKASGPSFANLNVEDEKTYKKFIKWKLDVSLKPAVQENIFRRIISKAPVVPVHSPEEFAQNLQDKYNSTFELPMVYLTGLGYITSNDIAHLEDYRKNLREILPIKGNEPYLSKAFHHLDRLDVFFAVLAANVLEFANKSEKEKEMLEYYISLLLLKTPIKKLDDAFPLAERYKYNVMLADLTVNNDMIFQHLKNAIKRKEEEKNPSSSTSSDTSQIVEPSNPQTPSLETSPIDKRQCPTEEILKMFRSRCANVTTDSNNRICITIEVPLDP